MWSQKILTWFLQALAEEILHRIYKKCITNQPRPAWVEKTKNKTFSRLRTELKENSSSGRRGITARIFFFLRPSDFTIFIPLLLAFRSLDGLENEMGKSRPNFQPDFWGEDGKSQTLDVFPIIFWPESLKELAKSLSYSDGILLCLHSN